LETLGWSRETVERRLQRIGETLTRLFITADGEQLTTEAAAARMAAERLTRSRPERPTSRTPALTPR
jgi:hypothetical protein